MERKEWEAAFAAWPAERKAFASRYHSRDDFQLRVGDGSPRPIRA